MASFNVDCFKDNEFFGLKVLTFRDSISCAAGGVLAEFFEV